MEAKNTLKHKHVFAGLILATNSNYSGDRDANGAPRIDAATGIGEMTDACIKRKLLNAMTVQDPDLELYVDIDRPMDVKIEEATNEAVGMTIKGLLDEGKKDRSAFLPVEQYLLNKYIDLRVFGRVLTKLNRAIKGPVQLTISQSVLPVEMKTYALTRKAIATEAKFSEEGASTMFGEKTVARHALFVLRGEISAMQAKKTCFSEEDKARLFEAAVHMFDFDKSASRSDMRLCCLYDFEYSDRLGLEIPTWRLWDALKVAPVPDVRDGVRPACSYSDYDVQLDEAGIPNSVTIHKLV